MIPVLLFVMIVGSIIYFIKSFSSSSDTIILASVLLLLVITCLLFFLIIRTYPMKVQDRAIRAEETLRYYILTSQRLDPRLSLRQIIALRFASDEELPNLARKAAETGMKPSDIKQSISNWRTDTYRI